MARQRDPKRDQAFELWKSSKGEKDLIDIATELDVPAGTIRGWKNKDKWEEKLNGTFQKSKSKNMERSNKNTERSKRKVETKGKSPPNEVEIEDVTEGLDLTPLNAKQQLFIKEYLVDLNASAAYLRAGYKSRNPDVDGYKLLVKPSIQEQIQEEMKKREKRTEITADKVLQELACVGFSKITDYISIAEVEIITGFELDEYGEFDKDRPIKKKIKTVDVYNTSDIPDEKVRAISEIKETKYGISVKLNDKLKALELIGRHLALFKEKVEHSGPNGGPIETNQTIDLSNLSDEELDALESIISKSSNPQAD